MVVSTRSFKVLAAAVAAVCLGAGVVVSGQEAEPTTTSSLWSPGRITQVSQHQDSGNMKSIYHSPPAVCRIAVGRLRGGMYWGGGGREKGRRCGKINLVK